jgi:uncharacterized membrane protein YqiK
MSITRLAEARREAGLKEAEVLREKISAQNAKTRDIMLQETVMALVQSAPAIVHELMKPAERIGEIKVLQIGNAGGGGGFGVGSGANGNGGGAQMPLLGNALGPVAKTILEASAMMPVLKEVMKFADAETLKSVLGGGGGGGGTNGEAAPGTLRPVQPSHQSPRDPSASA